MNLIPKDDTIDPRAISAKITHSLRRRQTQNQLPKLYLEPHLDMPPKTKESHTGVYAALPQSDSTSRANIGDFLRKFGKPIANIQKLIAEYPTYEDQFLDYQNAFVREKELVNSLEEKEKRILQLEAGVAVFDSVHMRASTVLKAENQQLVERLAEAEELAVASQKEFVKGFEKLIKQNKQDMEKTLRDHSTSLANQKTLLEKQHLDTTEKHLLQLDKAISEIQRQSIEIEKLDWMNNGLKKKLEQSNERLKTLQQDLTSVLDDDYESQWKRLAECFHSFCKTRFSSLPQGSTIEETKLQQQDIKERLLRSGFTDKLPFPIPTGNIEASKLLRLAGVENLISRSLCENVFRAVAIPDCSNASGIFESISERLRRENPWKEAMWRSLTVNALAEENTNLDSRIQQMVTDILKLTHPLIRAEDQDNVGKELMGLFKLAFDTWRPAQKNSARIFARTELTGSSSPDWDSHADQDDFEFTGAPEDDLVNIDPHSKVLCLFPRVYRESSFVDSESNNGPEDKGHVYFPGTALYADAGAFIVGQKEHRDYLKLMEELDKKTQVISTDPTRVSSRRSRRPSTSRAPQQPSPAPASFKARVNASQVGVDKKTEPATGSPQRPPQAIPKVPK